MTILDEVRQHIVTFTTIYDRLGYYSGSGDNDRDGTPDRADLNDRNGVDCSGWDWDLVCMLAAYGCYAPGTPYWPLGSSASYAALALDRHYVLANVPNGNGLRGVALQPGDQLIYDQYDQVLDSGGDRGHVGMVEHDDGDGVYTSESAGGGAGVGIYRRSKNFWNMAIRIPLRAPITPAPPPPPPPKLTSQEFAMPMVNYPPIGQTHRFFIPHSGAHADHLCHVWVGPGTKGLAGFEDFSSPKTPVRPFVLGPCDPTMPVEAMIDPVDLSMAVTFFGMDGLPNRLAWTGGLGPWVQTFLRI